FFGILCAAIYLITRIIVSKKRKSVIIPRSRPADIAALVTKVNNAYIKGGRATLAKNENANKEEISPDFAVLSPKSITLVYARNGSSPIGVDKRGRLRYESNQIEDFTVAVLGSAKSVAARIGR